MPSFTAFTSHTLHTHSCLSPVVWLIAYWYRFGHQLRWAFAFLVARRCATLLSFHCFILSVAQLANKLIDWLIVWRSFRLCTFYWIVAFVTRKKIMHRPRLARELILSIGHTSARWLAQMTASAFNRPHVAQYASSPTDTIATHSCLPSSGRDHCTYPQRNGQAELAWVAG